MSWSSGVAEGDRCGWPVGDGCVSSLRTNPLAWSGDVGQPVNRGWLSCGVVAVSRVPDRGVAAGEWGVAMSERIKAVIEAPIRECFGFDSPHEWVATRILAALKAAGIAVVDLPADDAKALEHFEFAHGGVRQYDPNGFGSSRWFSFDEIRTLAPALLAMLAAADAAEASR